MATSNPRIQVTVDPDLATALDRVGSGSLSRSRLVRNLALRGAEATLEDAARADTAVEVLTEIADGTRDYDLSAAAKVAARRDEHLR